MSARAMTAPQVARFLGTGVQSIHAAIDAGELRAINTSRGKKRKRWKILPADLEKFLAARSSQPKADPEKRRASKPKVEYHEYF